MKRCKRPGAPGTPAALVGRDRERAQLVALIGVAAEGQGGIVLVSGEAGVGKSALVDAALAGSPLLALRAAARAIATPPLGPIAHLAHALRREMPQAFGDAVSRHPALACLLPEAADVTGDIASDRAALCRMLTDGFCDLARQRALALVLDDMQWVDATTLELIAEMAREARRAPLLVVVIHRSEGVARGHPVRQLRDVLRRGRILNETVVEPLDRSDTLQLTSELLGGDVPAGVLDAIADRTGGIPLFVHAVTTALQARGGFDAAHADVATLPLPATVRDAILERVDALGAAGRQAAEAAAVAGTEFAMPLLVALNGSEPGVEALLASGLVREAEPGRAVFHTPLTREAIHSTVPWTRRRALHRRAAEVLTAAGASIEQAAEHWQAAGDDERARLAWIDAATRSRRLHAHADAIAPLRRALDLWPLDHQLAERLVVLEQLGDSAQLARRFADALRAWREVVECAATHGNPTAAGRALRKIATLHELNGDWTAALEARQDAAVAFAQAAEPAEAAVDLHAAGMRLRNAGHYGAALDMLSRAAAAAEAGSAVDTAIRIAALTGNVLARSGRVDDGIHAVRAALARALELNRLDLAADAYQRLADAVERSGNFAGAIEAYRGGIELCERHGLASAASACLMCMSAALLRAGAWNDAAASARRVIEATHSDAVAVAGAQTIQGLVHALRGEARRAQRLLVAGGAVARSSRFAAVELLSRWGLALQDAAGGDAAAAAERCRGVLARWRQTEEGGVATPILRWAASALAQVADRDGVRGCADALAEIVTRLGHAETLSALAHALGELALLEGDAARAAEQLDRAAALLDDRGLPLERAHSQLRAAVAHAAAGGLQAAVGRLRDAARGAEHLGARPLADAVAGELRRLGQPLTGALGPRAGRRAETGGLTLRQLQILGQVSKGLTDKEVARALSLSPRTVEMHVARALAVLDCRTRAEAVRKAAHLGLLA